MSVKDNNDDEQYTFDTTKTSTESDTEEVDRSGWNYTGAVAIYVSEWVNEYVNKIIESDNTEWSSRSAFGRDAIEHYLDAESVEKDAEVLIELSADDRPVAECDPITANIAAESSERIDGLIDHTQTPWDTKNEFGLAAISLFALEMSPEDDL